MKLLGCSVVLLAACGPRGGGAAAPEPVVQTVTVTLAGGNDPAAVVVAYQDGDGPWQAAPGEGGVFRLPIASGRYGVATSCRERGVSSTVYVQHATVADATAVEASAACALSASSSPRPWLTFEGEVRGLQDEVGFVSTSFEEEQVDGGAPRYRLLGRRGHAHDLVVVAARGDGAARHAVRFAIVRDLEIRDGAIVDVDLAAAAQTPAVRAVQVEGAEPGEVLTVRSAMTTGNGARATLSMDQTSPFELHVVPEAALGPDDVRWVQVVAERDGAIRSTTQAIAPGGDLAMSLGAPLGEVAVELVDGPDRSVLPRLSWPVHPEATQYQVSVSGAWDPTGDSGSFSPLWSISVSAGWLAAGGTPSYQLPALDHVDGWIRRDLKRGVPLRWSVVAATQRLGATQLPLAGVETRAAHRFGELTP